MAVKKLEETTKASLIIGNQSFDLPIITGTENEKAIDISSLRSDTGYVTLDHAFVNTASTISAITYLDGENGILRYRGYPIEQLAKSVSFIDVSYLLINGELPTPQEREAFIKKIKSYNKINPNIKTLISTLPTHTHPMALLSSTLVAMSAHNENFCKADLSASDREEIICQLMAAFKNLAACFYRHSKGLKFIEPDEKLSYCEDFLQMMFGEPPSSKVSEALNVLLILHADHEQNCSTSTVRLVGSSKANPYATIASGVNALWGPLHGGANEEVIKMLELIQKNGGNYKKFIEKAKDKNDPFKLMGFGHRVYKNFDPRAQIIKQACDEVLKTLNIKDPLLDIAKGLEEEALQDKYFVDRKLYPNVDFYSGIIYKALNIPSQMFTVMFALGRLPGWLAQWKEMLESAHTKIGRPRQIYTGKPERKI